MIIPAVIFEDEELIVINKPSGLTVNRSDTTKNETTLQDFVSKKVNFESLGPEDSDFVKRSGIVHRLDKETSGVILVAKNEETFSFLQGQFKERKVEKEYIALVHGIVSPKNGVIKVPVGRLPWNRTRFGVIAGGREAETFYEVISGFRLPILSEGVSLLRLHPKTGRTHQIRVHLKYFGHPVFGDSLYAGRKVSRRDRKVLDRLFLHAQSISFVHPKTKKTVSFTTKLPSDLLMIIPKDLSIII